MNPQRWNRYAYSLNNPLKYLDPDGRDVMLVARNNAGGGATNFGHTALRVYGAGYDKTYDFGRYNGGRGFLKAKGDGILRVWDNFDKFMQGQRPEGDLRTLNYTTSKETDQAIMGDFAGKIAHGKETGRDRAGSFKEYQLSEDYDLTSNNCTTMCLRALGDAQAKGEGNFPGVDQLKDEYDPRQLYKDVSGVKGSGVTYKDLKKDQQ